MTLVFHFTISLYRYIQLYINITNRTNILLLKTWHFLIKKHVKKKNSDLIQRI